MTERAVDRTSWWSNEAFAGVEADPELPVLPSVTTSSSTVKLGPSGWVISIGLRWCGAGRRAVGVESPRSAGTGRSNVVVHRRRDAAGEVDVGDDAVDRVRPRQVGRVGLVEAEHADHPVPELVLGKYEPADSGTDRTFGDVEAALGHGRDPALVGGEDRLDGLELLVEDRQLAVGDAVDLDVSTTAPRGDRDDVVAAVAGGPVEQQHPDPPLDRVARVEGEDGALVRLVEADVDELVCSPDQAGAADDVAGGGELLGGELGERVGGGGDGTVGEGHGCSLSDLGGGVGAGGDDEVEGGVRAEAGQHRARRAGRRRAAPRRRPRARSSRPRAAGGSRRAGRGSRPGRGGRGRGRSRCSRAARSLGAAEEDDHREAGRAA